MSQTFVERECGVVEAGGGVLLSALTILLPLTVSCSTPPKTTLFNVIYVIICFVFRRILSSLFAVAVATAGLPLKLLLR